MRLLRCRNCVLPLRVWAEAVGVACALSLGGASYLAAQHPTRAVTLSGGAGALGVTRTGLVPNLSAAYERGVNGWSHWWFGLQGMYDRDPGVASPGFRQSVTEMIVSSGPALDLALGARAAVTAGVGVYGVARRYGTGRSSAGGPALTSAGWGGGDWGTVGRAGLRVGRADGFALLLEGQFRVAREGSARRVQPMIGVGVRRRL